MSARYAACPYRKGVAAYAAPRNRSISYVAPPTVVHLKKEAVKTLLYGVAWIIGAFFFWKSLVGWPMDDLRLLLHSATTSGHITDAWEESESGENGTVWLHGATYRYRLPDGREIERETITRQGRLNDDFRYLSEPHPIEVEYLPTNPQISRIKGEGAQSLFEWVCRKAGFGLLLLGLFVSPGIVLLRNGVRQLKDRDTRLRLGAT